MIQSLLNVGWVGLGWAVHFLVHVGSQRTVPNSPLGHSHSIALNWSLCIMLHFMRWSSCAGPHHIGSSHWTREEKNFSLSNYSQLLPLSNRRPLRNSQKFTVSHRNYLATVYVISRFNATQQEWIFCRIKFNILNLRIVFSNIVVNFSSQICFDPTLLTIDCSWSRLLHSTNCCGSGARDADGQETGSNNRPVFFSWIPAFS